MIKNLSAVQETQVQSLSREDPLEKGMTTHLENSMDRVHGERDNIGDDSLHISTGHG